MLNVQNLFLLETILAAIYSQISERAFLFIGTPFLGTKDVVRSLALAKIVKKKQRDNNTFMQI